MPRPLVSNWLNLRQPSGGGGGAPTTAQYVTLALDATLTQERVLTAGVGITITDGGANGPVTITNTGVPGPTGATGMPGRDAEDGVDGMPGPPGPTGATGSTGSTGAQGIQGPPGLWGVDGEDGTDGPMGMTGPIGPQGIPGMAGFPGSPGEDGEDGQIGLPGSTGATGATGGTGATGAQGAQGLPGLAGVDGDDGVDGARIGISFPLQKSQLPLPLDHHADLSNFTANDDHTQYLLLAGRAAAANNPIISTTGSGIIAGSAAVGLNLTLQSTTNAAKGLINLDDETFYWPSFPGFTAGVTQTQDITRCNPTFTASPNAAAHSFNLLRFDSIITSAPVGAGDLANITGFNWAPTMNIGQNLNIKAISGVGTYTNTLASFLGSFLFFSAAPTLVSATATVAPYPATLYSCNAVTQYNATGTAAMAAGGPAGFVDGQTIQNLSSGTFNVTEIVSFASQPKMIETGGTLHADTVYGLRVRRMAVSATAPDITTHIGVDVENLAINFASAAIATVTPIAFRSAITSAGATSGTNARCVQDTGGATSEFKGLIIQSYTPTSQTVPTGFFAEYAKRQQWTTTQRLTLQGTSRLRGN